MLEFLVGIMKKLTSIFCIAGATLALASTSALACGSGAVQFTDNFATLAPPWGFVDKDDSRTNGPSGVSYKLTPNNSVFLMNSAGTYDDYEACGTFKVGKLGEDSAGFSVLFWLADNKNYYGASFAPRYGTFQVFRYQRGKYLQQNNWTENAAIKMGDDVVNEISVTVKGKHLTLAANGTKIFELDGQPPADGSLVGFDMFTGNTNKVDQTVTLSKFEVHDVPK